MSLKLFFSFVVPILSIECAVQGEQTTHCVAKTTQNAKKSP